jgi:hypothetical protein
MYQKNNFSNYFILATILAYVIGITFDLWRWRRDPGYSALIFDLQVAALGAYSLFCENEFLNTNVCYQVFVTSLITSYQGITSIQGIIGHRYDTYLHYVGIARSVLALAIHYKFPNFLVYIFRYEIGYSILFYSIPHIQGPYFTNQAVAASLSLGFVFISYLNFAGIVNLTSTLLFAYMLGNGVISIIAYIPSAIRGFDHSVAFGALIGIIFVVAVYCQNKKNISQGILLGRDVPNYNPNPTEV